MNSENRLNDDRKQGEIFRHWCPDSEAYATADSLMGVLRLGWEVVSPIFRQVHWRGGSGGRRIPVYHVRLRNGMEQRTMTLVHSPGVERIVRSLPVQVVVMNQRKDEGRSSL